MFDVLNQYGLPVKYAVIGLLGGIIWLIIATVIDYETHNQVIGLIGFTVGGAIGGYIRKRMGKST